MHNQLEKIKRRKKKYDVYLPLLDTLQHCFVMQEGCCDAVLWRDRNTHVKSLNFRILHQKYTTSNLLRVVVTIDVH
ncbi:hypothetical protein E2C01_023307 [Portunus trituberculatus]|uniref:Uncharacterized protein n=1 Tax=Portunus trituberculatus TaxID=210409 RepID=A0A5B7EAS6_PORTR|nr:hypothetical protein [Portunus trituberculatus]